MPNEALLDLTISELAPSITTTDWRIRRLTVLVQLRISDRGKIAAVLWQVQFPRRKHLVS